MQLVTTLACNLACIEVIRSLFTNSLKVGLLQGETEPQRDWTMTNITPAVFSGYNGMQPVSGWAAPVLVGQRWVIRALPVVWWHNGGPSQGTVSGYYVTDLAGVLQWAQRYDVLNARMAVLGDTFRVVPELSDFSQYP